jgi:Response regulator containing a CheY-like receiver domain and a GGDEF domain
MAAEIAHERSPFRQAITASFGVGTVIPSESGDPVAFVNLVDTQLYHAKDNGRDCIAAVNRVG